LRSFARTFPNHIALSAARAGACMPYATRSSDL
jgi:hypothetical protein